ncbi:MAG: hypothetical protein H7329_00480 [Opitutaceae bacterium]|nr:hypothetical protein [Cytophagales bacterium]
MKHLIHILTLLILINMNTSVSVAQCAMCKASVEKSESEAASFNKRATGLNAGILYLMAIPYILAGIIAFYWYKTSNKERDRKNEIQRIIRSKMSQMPGGQNI